MKSCEAFEAYLDYLEKAGINYKLDETARCVLQSIDMHLVKNKGKNNDK